MGLFPWKRAVRMKSVWFSLLVILGFGLVAVFADHLAPQDPYKFNPGVFRLPPMWVHAPGNAGQPEYPLGTDIFGRDVLSRLLFGTRTAFVLALTAVPITALLGTLLGLAAGHFGGRVDAVFQFLTETLQSLPGLMLLVILIIIIRSRLEPTWLNGLLTLGLGYAAISWVNLARQVRMNVLLVKGKLFIEAAISLGATDWRIITRHLLPNILHVVLAWIVNNIPAIILLEAVLGYIRVSLTSTSADNDFTAISWGGMFSAGWSAMKWNPLILIIPSLCILLLSMSFILLADFIRSASRPDEG